MELEAARELIRGNGEVAVYSSGRIQIKNSGVLQSAIKEIGKQGFKVENERLEQTENWAIQETEMRYLGTIGLASLICAWQHCSQMGEFFYVMYLRCARASAAPYLSLFQHPAVWRNNGLPDYV